MFEEDFHSDIKDKSDRLQTNGERYPPQYSGPSSNSPAPQVYHASLYRLRHRYNIRYIGFDQNKIPVARITSFRLSRFESERYYKQMLLPATVRPW